MWAVLLVLSREVRGVVRQRTPLKEHSGDLVLHFRDMSWQVPSMCQDLGYYISHDSTLKALWTLQVLLVAISTCSTDHGLQVLWVLLTTETLGCTCSIHPQITDSSVDKFHMFYKIDICSTGSTGSSMGFTDWGFTLCKIFRTCSFFNTVDQRQ